MKKLLLLSLLSILMISGHAQEDSVMIRKIYDELLLKSPIYDNLHYLTKEIGHRLSGSPQAAAGVEYTRQLMQSYDFDTVFLQPVMVPHWVRGTGDQSRIVKSVKGERKLKMTAIGNSVGTGNVGLTARVLEVQGIDDLNKHNAKEVSGKIVFFNRSFDYTLINTFHAYGGAVRQRGGGASAAAKLGAVAVVVRSMASQQDDIPHTGALRYQKNVKQIPAIAISTNDASYLSDLLKQDGNLEMYIETHGKMMGMEPSFNVVGQIYGSEHPDEIILVGGHLDSWDVGEGAHDDGGGCMQSVEVLRVFKALGIQPRHTLRAVMFMNEENGGMGGRAYAKRSNDLSETHLAAIESDRGAFTPRGFTVQNNDIALKKVRSWADLLFPYGIREFTDGHGGSDIGPLNGTGVVLMGFVPDSQRYFTLHHTDNDVLENVNIRELQLGAAAITAMVYLIDQHGL